MQFAIVVSLGLALLMAASMARQLTFRGGRIVGAVCAAGLATAASALLLGADPAPCFAAALVGGAIGAALAPKN